MSKLWTLQTQDLLHGLIAAILMAILKLLYTTLQSGGTIDWKSVLSTGILAGIGFILLRFGSDENNKILGKV